jgi:uncharacterized protein YhbP (UPF0306 family)
MEETLKYLKRVAALLRDESTLALATTSEEGEPSVAPLFYIADEALSLYWLSSKNSLHSRDLARNARASIAIYRDTGDWKKIRGVQMRGRVGLVTGARRRGPLIDAYCKRFRLGTVLHLAIRRSTLYVFEPRFIRLIDNAKGFGSKFELRREDEGWRCTRAAE